MFGFLSSIRPGNIEWQNAYGAGGQSMGFSIVPTSDGGFIEACDINDDFALLKLTAGGDVVWEMSYKGATPGGVLDWMTNILQTQDGGYIVPCSYFTGSRYDLLLLKLSPDGTISGFCSMPQNVAVTTSPTRSSPSRRTLSRLILP